MSWIMRCVHSHAYDEYLAIIVISVTKELHITFRLKKGLTATRIYYCYKSLKHFTTCGDTLRGSYITTDEKGKTVFRQFVCWDHKLKGSVCERESDCKHICEPGVSFTRRDSGREVTLQLCQCQ